MIDRSTPIPLYFQLAEQLRADILAGSPKVGAQLPAEQELATLHGVSRSVVRQALLKLTQDGLVETERGRRATVRDRMVPIPLRQKIDPLAQAMASAGFRLKTKVLAQKLVKAPPHIAAQIGEAQAVFLERLRFANDEVFLLVRNYLPASRVPGLERATGLADVSLHSYLFETYGISIASGQRTIEIGRVDALIGSHLGLPGNTPALFNRETSRDEAGRAVEYYESWHHPERTRLTIDLYRG